MSPSELQLRHRDFLRTFAIFKNFHPNELLLLAQHLSEVRLERNEIVFKEGDPGDSCFFIVFGKVKVLKPLPNGKYEQLAKLKGGQLFGQISLIDGQPRSATCVAEGRVLMLELSKAHFDRMFEMRETFAFRFQDYLTRVMVMQVRQANKKLAELVNSARKKNLDAGVDGIFDQMKDAMKSAQEMGIDLDEVEYSIAPGQRRPKSDEDVTAAREKVTDAMRKAPSPKAQPGQQAEILNLDDLEDDWG